MLAALAAAALLALPAAAQVAERNFSGGRTGDLAALCGAPASDPMHTAAVNYCQGFIVGAGQFHASTAAAHGDSHRMFCLPTPEPTLEQARTAFVAWAARNPQHAGDRAVDGLARFAAETWPCPRAAQPRARR
ncbi:hypothetical protein CKO45_13490 [Paracraurococcus ruber]|uniref:Rap1a immunity protein domain-containing protein n=2 Tax=Paracraurococcus ruber TaxID=77675 RepID=A0ABS1CXI4_9PROT|nr:hypothetical protein [Paracraurococcus ruber]